MSNTPYDGGRWVNDGGWWVTDGGWWVTDGGWWVATKHQRVDAIVKKKKGERPYGTPCRQGPIALLPRPVHRALRATNEGCGTGLQRGLAQGRAKDLARKGMKGYEMERGRAPQDVVPHMPLPCRPTLLDERKNYFLAGVRETKAGAFGLYVRHSLVLGPESYGIAQGRRMPHREGGTEYSATPPDVGTDQETPNRRPRRMSSGKQSGTGTPV